jgi:hypothetical protein
MSAWNRAAPAVPFITFALIYLLAVRPAHERAVSARLRADEMRQALHDAASRDQQAGVPALASQVNAQTLGDLATAVKRFAVASHAENLSVDADGVSVAVSFDTGDAELASFLSSLDTVSGPFAVQSVDVTAARAPLPAHARVVLAGRETLKATAPEPVLQMLSEKEKAALVSGRIVRAGDRIQGLTVKSIDARGVVLTSDTGEEKRLSLQRKPTTPAKE